jgi:predicted nucleic acid-binding protein
MISGTPERAIIDTSVYVENLRYGRFEAELLKLPFLVRVSAVVVAELTRGARSRQATRFVERLVRNFPVVAPSVRDWVRSGRVVRVLADRRDCDAHKIRELHFDVLIALTAQGIGARLITCNAADFQAIREILAFKLTCW